MPLRKRPGSPNYMIDCVLADGTRYRKSSGTNNKKLAEQLEAKIKREVFERVKLGIKAKPESKRTWDDAVNAWLSNKDSEFNSVTELSRIKWLNTFLANKPLDEITEDEIELLTDTKRSQGAKPATINRTLATLSAILHTAKKRKWIAEVPHIERCEVGESSFRWLTGSEWQRLQEELPAHLRQLARLAIATGLRRANCTHLEWSQVSISQGHISIQPQKAKGRKPILIPLNDNALAVLNEQLGLHDRWVFPVNGEPLTVVKGKEWDDACDRAGIGNFRFHDLRHTWASWHRMNGTDLDTLMKLGAWSSIQCVMIYAHMDISHLARAATNCRPINP